MKNICRKSLVMAMLIAPIAVDASPNPNVAAHILDSYHAKFIEVDLDRNGLISRDELEFYADKRHRLFDEDADGAIPLDDWTAASAKVGSASDWAHLNSIDSNEDGILTVDEARKAIATLFIFDFDNNQSLSFSEIFHAAPPAIRRFFDLRYMNGS